MMMALKPWRPHLSRSVLRTNMAAAGAALTIAGVLLIAFQFVALRAALVRDVHVQARIIGANSVAALLFDDRRAAEETLGALAGSPSLRAAGVFTAQRLPLGLYQRGMRRRCGRPTRPCCATRRSPPRRGWRWWSPSSPSGV